MQCFILLCWSVLLLCLKVQGLYFEHIHGEDQFNDNLDSLSKHLMPSTSDDPVRHSNGSFELYNSSPEYQLEQESSKSSSLSISNPRAEQPILTSTNASQLQSAENFTAVLKAESATTDIRNSEILTLISNNESLSQSTEILSTESSSITNENTQSSNKSTLIFVTPGSVTNQSISPDSNEEHEGVIIVEPFSLENGTITAPHEKTLYQRALEIVNDAYTLSIVVPVAAGIVFATTIILTIATCRCLRRRCRRRRIRRNAKLPDSVKSLRPSDSARLLAESSDEEF